MDPLSAHKAPILGPRLKLLRTPDAAARARRGLDNRSLFPEKRELAGLSPTPVCWQWSLADRARH